MPEGEVWGTKLGAADRSKIEGDQGSELVYSYGSFDGTNNYNTDGSVSVEVNMMVISEVIKNETSLEKIICLWVDALNAPD